MTKIVKETERVCKWCPTERYEKEVLTLQWISTFGLTAESFTHILVRQH